MKNRLSPSVLAADFGALREDIYLAEEAGAESFHFDIMDGHFVPNLSYGLSLVSSLDEILPILSYVLLMSVNPGFGGQKFIPYSLDKVKRLRKLAEARGLDLEIGIDGGVGLQNIRDILDNGANFIIAGSSVFSKKEEVGESVRQFNRFIRKN